LRAEGTRLLVAMASAFDSIEVETLGHAIGCLVFARIAPEMRILHYLETQTHLL
jgi:hypothetical protein